MAVVIIIKAQILDPDDGEAGIVEVMSGRVLGRFPSLRHASQTLRRNRGRYERLSVPSIDHDKRDEARDSESNLDAQHIGLQEWPERLAIGDVMIVNASDDRPMRVSGALQ